eukprot:CAMPEP_0178954168 /NCGR_PEP_ID=MMETSP0789-20121207/8836_1 /TAXON_ID=3005 /ORGANISM="Rhizosolenia setigera, Strain CCMP 1694" /LENGTH=319 /DNA_ID=CAMNT_0020635531 /DNA_START=302 /DNA_END=1261 /DNA_ORIENTATION=-
MASFHKACTTPPGRVTKYTMSKFDNYPYDNVLYSERMCSTENIRKIARSKYCKITKQHVPRFDHYCGWINQAVGEENYRYFLFFLYVQVAMCMYSAYGMTLFFMEQIEILQDDETHFLDERTGEHVFKTNKVIFNYIVSQHSALSGVYLLVVVMGLCLYGFLAFHVMLVYCNMTTNEFYKWRVIRKWHSESKKNYLKALKEGKVIGNTSSPNVPGKSTANAVVTEALDDANVGCIGISLPENSKGNKMEHKLTILDQARGYRNKTIVDPGPMPSNVYNIGIMGNVFEVLLPRSHRKAFLARSHKFPANERKRQKLRKRK